MSCWLDTMEIWLLDLIVGTVKTGPFSEIIDAEYVPKPLVLLKMEN